MWWGLSSVAWDRQARVGFTVPTHTNHLNNAVLAKTKLECCMSWLPRNSLFYIGKPYCLRKEWIVVTLKWRICDRRFFIYLCPVHPRWSIKLRKSVVCKHCLQVSDQVSCYCDLCHCVYVEERMTNKQGSVKFRCHSRDVSPKRYLFFLQGIPVNST